MTSTIVTQVAISIIVGVIANLAFETIKTALVKGPAKRREQLYTLILQSKNIYLDTTRFSAITQAKLLTITAYVFIAGFLSTLKIIDDYAAITAQQPRILLSTILSLVAAFVAGYFIFDLYIFLRRYRDFPAWERRQQKKLDKISTTHPRPSVNDERSVISDDLADSEKAIVPERIQADPRRLVIEPALIDGEQSFSWSQGIVQNWNADRGFGHIVLNEHPRATIENTSQTAERFFFHFTHMCCAVTPDVGDIVFFVAVKRPSNGSAPPLHRHAFLVAKRGGYISGQINGTLMDGHAFADIEDAKGNYASALMVPEQRKPFTPADRGKVVQGTASRNKAGLCGQNAHLLGGGR